VSFSISIHPKHLMPHFIMLTSLHLCFSSLLALQTNATALALVDVDEKKLKGECLDLIQGTAFSSRHVRITYVSFFVIFCFLFVECFK